MQQQLISRIGTVNKEDVLRMLNEELFFSLQVQEDISAFMQYDLTLILVH